MFSFQSAKSVENKFCQMLATNFIDKKTPNLIQILLYLAENKLSTKPYKFAEI